MNLTKEEVKQPIIIKDWGVGEIIYKLIYFFYNKNYFITKITLLQKLLYP